MIRAITLSHPWGLTVSRATALAAIALLGGAVAVATPAPATAGEPTFGSSFETADVQPTPSRRT